MPGYITHMKNVDPGLPGCAGAELPGGFSPRAASALAGAVIVMASSVACQESLTEVDSGVVAPALRPALKIAHPLPGLADIATAGRSDGHETPLLTRWEESWNRGVAAGRPLREEIYGDTGSLVLDIDSATARSVAVAVRTALAEARSFDASLPPHLTGALEEAGGLLEEAGEAAAGGSWTVSALKALKAADALRETAPRAVALSLVEAAEEALGPPPGEEEQKESVDTARARRLAWWGRLAIGAGGYALAIQRGYYACLLLDVELP